MKYLIPLFSILLISCGGTTALVKNKVETKQVVDFKKVPLKDLLLYKGKYHNQYIETEGYYLSGYEISSLFDVVTFPSGDTLLGHIDYVHGIWIEFDYKHRYLTSDTIQKRVIKVRGLFDTTRTGHLELYEATLLKAIVSH